MAFAVPSKSSNQTTSGTTLAITKPTGLAVGDLMICVASAQGGSVTVNTLSGWTSADFEAGLNNYTKIQYKVADAGDVAASDFTFASDFTVSHFAGTIMRVTGQASSSIVDVSDSQNRNSTASATVNFTGTFAIANDGSLIVTGFCASVVGAGGAGSIGSYVASDGSLSWTELHDYGQDIGSGDPIMGGAYAIQATKATLTSYGATLSLTREIHTGVLAVFRPLINASGTVALLTPNVAHFAGTASAGGTGTNTLFTPNVTHLSQSGEGTAPTQWTPQTKTSTTWTPN